VRAERLDEERHDGKQRHERELAPEEDEEAEPELRRSEHDAVVLEDAAPKPPSGRGRSASRTSQSATSARDQREPGGDEEDVPRADPVREEAADERSDDRAARDRGLERSERVAHPVARRRGGHERERGRDESADRSLEEAEEEELPHRRRESHERGGHREAERRAHHHELPPVPVPEESQTGVATMAERNGAAKMRPLIVSSRPGSVTPSWRR
jgi:hypothetical protein